MILIVVNWVKSELVVVFWLVIFFGFDVCMSILVILLSGLFLNCVNVMILIFIFFVSLVNVIIFVFFFEFEIS